MNVSQNVIQIAGKTFELVKEHKGAWNVEAFRERYSEVLDRYDFIVGDWGYNQLRLKGFYYDNHSKATKDNSLGSLEEYLIEHCNFGCAYFILKRQKNQQNTKHNSYQRGAKEHRDEERRGREMQGQRENRDRIRSKVREQREAHDQRAKSI